MARVGGTGVREGVVEVSHFFVDIISIVLYNVHSTTTRNTIRIATQACAGAASR